MSSRFRNTLNPAFAQAHGIQGIVEDNNNNNENENDNGIVDVEHKGKNSSSSKQQGQKDKEGTFKAPSGPGISVGLGVGSKRLELILKEARAAGKLQAVHAGLKSPLPETLFDLRLGLAVNLSLDDHVPSSSTTTNSSSNRPDQPQQVNYAEETLTLVDFSYNEEIQGCLDERVTRYKQVQIMRWKRCSLSQIMMISPMLSKLRFLRILDLSGNQLTHLDWTCFPSPSLQELNLSQNQIQEIRIHPMASSEPEANARTKLFPCLTSLDISENQLSTLDLPDCPQLRQLQLSKNKLQYLPTSLDVACETLQHLDLSYNRLGSASSSSTNTTIPTEDIDLSKYSNLQTLLLAFNKLEHVPCISMSVTRLDLTTNRIKSIQNLFPKQNEESITDTAESPSTSSSPSCLMDLMLHDNYLNDLDPTVISKCIRLQRLDVSANTLKTLPFQLGFLADLKHLSLAGNPLVTFKSSEMEQPMLLLQTLRNRAPKESNGTSNVHPVSSTSPSPSSTTPKLLNSVLIQNTSIHMSGGKTSQRSNNAGGKVDLVQLVQELKNHPSMALGISGQVQLDGNQFDQIPEDLFPSLSNVSEISLQDNRLEAVPPSLGTSCPRLQKLNLARNRIKDLPPSWNSPLGLPWSSTLVRLDLSANRLTKISGAILQQLVQLQMLNLSCNKITNDLEKDWSQYFMPSTLTHLDLSENAISTMDTLVLQLGGQCRQLQMLNLTRNDIHRIPSTVGIFKEVCPDLKVLNLQGNPQHSIRSEILSKPVHDQLTYLWNRLTTEQKESAKNRMEQFARGDISITNSKTTPGNGGSTSELHTTPLLNPSNETPPATASSLLDTLRSNIISSSDNKNPGNGGTGSNINELDTTPLLKPSNETPPATASLLDTYRANIEDYERQLDHPSISQAKRYALKKSLAMERSKLIREERKLGILGKK